jgi:hypothetical protein
MERSEKIRSIGRLVAVILVVLAMSLTFVVSVRERRCAPLELEFKIDPQAKPERGGSWDRGSSSMRAPDPTGWVSVTTNGKRYGESIAQRKNSFDFRGRFYSRRGVPLERGSKIAVTLVDKDLRGSEPLGKIEHTVLLPNRGTATSSNGIVELVYTCHSDASPLDFFSNLFSR